MIATPPTNGTPTSAAAARATAGRTAIDRERIVAFLHRRGFAGATADEMEHGIPMGGNTLRPRLLELRTASRVCKLGQKRETRTGNLAEVWIVAGPRQTDLAEAL